MVLTPQQAETLKRISDFASDSSKSIFILKGYAGTGKTTVVKYVVPELQRLGKNVMLMAPTGRAAKVLHDKTGYPTSTIHRGIYSFKDMQVVRYDEDGNLIENGQANKETQRSNGSDDLQFWFSIREHNVDNDPSRNVYIIDEASMISSRRTNGETLHFGTDILMDDLLTYAQLRLGGKIIFVGDPAQLPPVGDNRSVAFDAAFFREKDLDVSECELKEVLRQKGESLILKNAMQVRDVLQSTSRNQLCFERKEGEVEEITEEMVVESFYRNNPVPSIGDAIVIAFTNSLAKDYNDALRRRYFPGCDHVMAGDILQVVRNNVNLLLGMQLFNGDFAKVLEVSQSVETLSAPVWKDIAGRREKVVISIDFRDVVLQTEDGTVMKCKMVDTLLRTRDPNLTPLQSVALYINFRIRHPELKKDEEAFREALMRDPYFNAVQVKYGYAITGHKSQGGEWDVVYADYSGRTGLNDECLRWNYTVTTRAARVLYGVNIPNVKPMSKLKFNAIGLYSKPSKEAFSYADVKDVEFLPTHADAFRKQKCLCVKQQLDAQGYLLRSIQCCQYNDRYTVEVPSGTVIVDCYYNGAGLFTRYLSQSNLPETEALISLFQNADDMQFVVNYVPSNEMFKQLYEKMKSACDGLDVVITNIVEHVPQYYVAYYLKTTGRFAQVLFYFDKNKAITYALPSSDLGVEDEKLQDLMLSIKSV